MELRYGQDAQKFFANYENWATGFESLAVALLALKLPTGCIAVRASCVIGPKRFEKPWSLKVETTGLLAISYGANVISEEVRAFVDAFRAGGLKILDTNVSLMGEILDLRGDSVPRDRSLITELRVNSIVQEHPAATLDERNVDRELRALSEPYDGFADLLLALGFPRNTRLRDYGFYQVTMHPPADFDGSSVVFANGKYSGNILKHHALQASEIKLSIRTYPSSGLIQRKEITEQLLWHRNDDFDIGEFSGTIEDSFAVLFFLVVGEEPISQWWADDPNKRTNQRAAISEAFDPKGKILLDYLSPPKEKSKDLEKGIENLLYFLGFSTFMPVNPDAPDVVAETPTGRVILIECTVTISDIRKKASKLVSRRSALIEQGFPAQNVLAILATSQPRGQIEADEGYLREQKVILGCKEDIATAVNRLRGINRADELFDELLAQQRVSQPIS